MPHTLLLADDSVTIQRVIELTFADEDVRVVAVSDGGEAIALLDRTPPDIVLADVGMPGQNGYAVARHIRDTPSLAHIPIVLLTGAFEPIDQAKVAEVGCDGVLAKPFEPQLVIARVKELLGRAKEPPPAEEPAAAVADQIMRAPVAVVENTPSRDTIDRYFDRLDHAFSQRPGSGSPEIADPADEPETPSSPEEVQDAVRAVMNGATAPEPPVREPLQRPAEAPPATAQPAPVFPALAEAFAALLEAEQSAPAPAVAPSWPVSPASMPAVAPALPDDFVEQVTRRVLEQLSDRVVRETTAEIVAGVAERLIKEEIQRIKDSIRG